jgi:hypothetical protein
MQPGEPVGNRLVFRPKAVRAKVAKVLEEYGFILDRSLFSLQV